MKLYVIMFKLRYFTILNQRGVLVTLCYIVTHVDSHLHTCTYICRITHNDTMTKTDAWRKEAGRKTQEDFFNNILPLTLFVRFACERVLETEHKLHILTPLLWPSRCVFLVLLDSQPEVLGSTPSGLFQGPPWSGVAFPTTSGLYCLEVY